MDQHTEAVTAAVKLIPAADPPGVADVAAEYARSPIPNASVADLIRVAVVADSVVDGEYVRPDGVTEVGRDRLLTYRVTAPRVILAEINTHRVLSRSSESSRAIPAKTRLGQLTGKPYRPLRMGARKPGMGAGADLDPAAADRARVLWEYARRACVWAAANCPDLAKEEVNRLTEPWALCRTVVSGTDWDNFFAMRTHETAFAPFRALARAMYVAYRRSVPRRVGYGEWHLPFIAPDDYAAAATYQRHNAAEVPGSLGARPHTLARSWEDYHLARWSAARAARVSYGLLDGRPATPEADDATWAKLVGVEDPLRAAFADPADLGPGTAWPYRAVHASPLEIPATPLHPAQAAGNPRLRSNVRGWAQLRKLIGGEVVRKFDPPPEVVAEWEQEIPPEVFSGRDLY